MDTASLFMYEENDAVFCKCFEEYVYPVLYLYVVGFVYGYMLY